MPPWAVWADFFEDGVHGLVTPDARPSTLAEPARDAGAGLGPACATGAARLSASRACTSRRGAAADRLLAVVDQVRDAQDGAVAPDTDWFAPAGPGADSPAEVEAHATEETEDERRALSRACSVRASPASTSGWSSHEYAAYDPFDGLSSWVRPLAVTPLSRQVLQQGVRRFPWNLRPLLGIKPATSTKAVGYLARAYLKLYGIGGDLRHLAAPRRVAWRGSWKPRAPGTRGSAGAITSTTSRGSSTCPKGEPTVVWTALIAHAFLDAWEVTGKAEYAEAATSVAEFILTDLERRPEGEGTASATSHRRIDACTTPACWRRRRWRARRRRAATGGSWTSPRPAIAYTVGCQRDDGSWWYGEAENLHWVDNFHTGYVLDSLWHYMRASGDDTYRDAFARGAGFFTANFFLADGTPRYYWDRTWPVDIQCAAQAIETLVAIAEAHGDDRALARARQVAVWTIENMQDADGYFYFQRWPLVVNRTPMLHWGQATMLHALAVLLEKESNTDED